MTTSNQFKNGITRHRFYLQEICPVHSTILPKTHWSFYSTVDELDELIESLNVRGIREHELKEKLVHERDRIVKSLKKAPAVVGKLAQDDEDLAKIEKKEGRKVLKLSTFNNPNSVDMYCCTVDLLHN